MIPRVLTLALAAVALTLAAAPASAQTKKKTATKTGTTAPTAPAKAGAPAPTTPAPAPSKVADEEFGPSLPPPPPPPTPAPGADAEVTQKAPFKMSRGQIIAAAKVGGAFGQPFGLGASFVVGAELGWALPKLPVVGEGFAVTFDFLYSQPGASGVANDPRVDTNAGNYKWDVTMRETSLGLTVLYRAPFLMGGRLVPYLGVGPRLFLLKSVTGGEAGAGNEIMAYSEQSTRVGLGAPLGAEFAIGPGRVFLEAMLLWAPVNLNVTGEGAAGAVNVQAGYRFLL